MTEQLVFGSPEAKRIAAEIKFMERVDRCPNCGQFAEIDKFVGCPPFTDYNGIPLPGGVYYRLGCPECRLWGDWAEDRSDAALVWSMTVETWWELNGERLNLEPPEEENGL